MPNTYINGNLSAGNVGSGSLSHSSGSVYSTSVGNITIDASYGIPKRSDSPDLPPIVVDGYDENGAHVRMKLAPEANISSSDIMKILMLALAGQSQAHTFNPLAYVKKHNLERHFTYS